MGVLDDGYETGAPALAPIHNGLGFAVFYACGGCDDLGHRGLVQHCMTPLVTSMDDEPGVPVCQDKTPANNATTRWVAAAAVHDNSSAVLIAYDDYGGQFRGQARYLAS